MTYPITPSTFSDNPYDPEWYERDFIYSQDGVKEYPKHHCKGTFLVSLPFVRSFHNAVDIGCRDGEYSRYLQKHFEHVYCFDPRFRKFFPFNVDLAKVTHFTCALGDKDETIEMSGGTHKLVEGKMTSFACFRLDEFELPRVDYIKVDVEGFEKKVLMGAEDTIGRSRPLIVIEQNDVCLPGEDRFAAKAWLEARGYRHVATCERGWDYVMSPGD